jgi:hypothetical protein
MLSSNHLNYGPYSNCLVLPNVLRLISAETLIDSFKTGQDSKWRSPEYNYDLPLGAIYSVCLFVSLALQPSAGYGLLVPRGFMITHNDAPQSVGLLWTSDQLFAETST